MKIFWLILALFTAGVVIVTLSSFIQKDLRQQLVGDWQNVYLKVRLNIYDSSRAPQIMEADSSNWETRLGIKPIRTHFDSNGTYNSVYRNLKDSVFRTAAGTWSLKGDSLTMNQVKPGKAILKLHLSIESNHATFSGIIDFEGNGKTDDEYYGIQRKVYN